MWAFEKKAALQGFINIAGTDEAGRGPLAGPVVSAAVILPVSFSVAGVDDSKKLSPKKRDYLFDKICEKAVATGTGLIDSAEIDKINILKASILSMSMAVKQLDPAPDYLLIDGNFKIDFPLPPESFIKQESLIKGDSRSISIAAASIIAKVTRDRLMEKYHEKYPQYGFASHKGYPTKAHKEAIKQFGPCRIHRRTFKGVKEYIKEEKIPILCSCSELN